MRRKDRERDAAFALDLLAHCTYATLATSCPDGRPYCIPISPLLIGEDLYFHCALEGKKLENLAHCQDVCVSCVGRTKLVPEKLSTEFTSAVAFGSASMVEDAAEKLSIILAICEKYGATDMLAARKACSASLPRMGICKIHITEITGKEKCYPVAD